MLESYSILKCLSFNYAVLRRRIKNHLLQLSLHCTLISLINEKLITMIEKQKTSVTEDKEYMYFFNLNNLFQRILMFKFTQIMHFDFEEFCINSIEL